MNKKMNYCWVAFLSIILFTACKKGDSGPTISTWAINGTTYKAQKTYRDLMITGLKADAVQTTAPPYCAIYFYNYPTTNKTYNVDTSTSGFLDLYNKENIYGVYPDWEKNDDLYLESNGYQTAAVEHLNEIYTILNNLIKIPSLIIIRL